MSRTALITMVPSSVSPFMTNAISCPSERKRKSAGTFQFRPFSFKTLRANTMAEFRSGLLLDVGFETLPVVFGSVYLVTVGTDRNQLLELVNFSRKPKNSIRDTQSHPNRDGIKRLRQEIVNAGLSGEVVVFRASLQGGEKDEIGIRCVRARPHSATKLQAVHSWHHPIAYDNAHGSAIERFPRFGSGARAHHFVPHPLEGRLQKLCGHSVVFSDQDFHLAGDFWCSSSAP